jgi:hypothetical protein
MKKTVFAGAACVGAIAASARAQEAINTPAATQPGAGHAYLVERLRWTRTGDDPSALDRETDEIALTSTLTVGVTGEVSLSFSQVAYWFDEERDEGGGGRVSEQGVDLGDLTALARWRFAEWHPGPVDTTRLMVYGGVETSVGRSDLYADSTDPLVGMVATIIRGRHGLTLNASWQFTTDGLEFPHGPGEGQADLLRADAAYLYRLAPETFAGDTTAAWYAVAEVNGLYETNGDTEVFLSPGILYEGTSWAAELGVQIPVYQRLDARPETEVTIVAGLRFLF